MTASRKPNPVSLSTALGRAAAAVAVLCAVALLAAPVGAADTGTGRPQFYTDEFHFAFQNDEQTAVCGFPVRQTFNGYVHGWTRPTADGSVAENVLIKFDGVYYTDQAEVPWSANWHLTDVVHPDGSGPSYISGIRWLVTVPGHGAVDLEVGRLVVTFPAGGGEPTFEVVGGQNTGNAFEGSPGRPGLLCELLA